MFEDTNIEESDGSIYFKIPNMKHIICIEPLNNRGILFPGYYIHKPTGYNRVNNNLRISITWKFQDLDIPNDGL
jgi:hypothetical protein